ncbi:MAG: GNAT family N-acetyltransferase [Rhodothermia bacterium]|nr:MAG: GNAT family N-acetyltransferase [Rhodothermia bacterium]
MVVVRNFPICNVTTNLGLSTILRIPDSIRRQQLIRESISDRRPNVYPTYPIRLPDEALASGGYSLRFANSEAELDAIYKLRYEVFNLELAEGLNSSHETGRDEDEFDPYNHHLYVTEDVTGHCIGTYRMQTSAMASNGIGFYARTEFDFSTFPDSIFNDSVEVGRACIASGHRTLRVLHLLWRGLGIYLAHNEMRYLFGCCSLTSQDEREGLAVYRYLQENEHVLTDWTLYPLAENECRSPDPVATNVAAPDPVSNAGDISSASVKIPRLMRTYLSQGAKICGPPAIDRAFKTIDYLALFDTKTMSKGALAFYRIKG